ncbi:MAG: hypothetical protein IT477_10815 [Rhodanobacteraceae bacterium]|nr:hypothetical protein [Rhodanobacteraceae bacterium]
MIPPWDFAEVERQTDDAVHTNVNVVLPTNPRYLQVTWRPENAVLDDMLDVVEGAHV